MLAWNICALHVYLDPFTVFFSCIVLSYFSNLLSDLYYFIKNSKFRIMICDMDELKGTNTVTGADSRASFYCQERLFSN